ISSLSSLGAPGFTAKKKEIFQQASQFYDRLGTPDQRFDALANLGATYLGVRRTLEALQTYQKAARLPVAKTDGGRAGVYFGYGQVYETLGVRSLAARYYEMASKLYGSAGRAVEKAVADEALKRVLPGGTMKAHPINL